jgi:hypothetical protein
MVKGKYWRWIDHSLLQVDIIMIIWKDCGKPRQISSRVVGIWLDYQPDAFWMQVRCITAALKCSVCETELTNQLLIIGRHRLVIKKLLSQIKVTFWGTLIPKTSGMSDEIGYKFSLVWLESTCSIGNVIVAGTFCMSRVWKLMSQMFKSRFFITKVYSNTVTSLGWRQRMCDRDATLCLFW